MDNIQPDSSPLPHFEWTDSEGTLRPIATTVDDPAPRKITEYHINPVNWVTLERYTPDEILSPESAHVVCKVCNGGLYKDGKSNRGVPPCPGTPCVETFRREACEPAEKLVEIRETARMGLGVFAKVDIPRGTWLGEYLGELFPYDAEVFPLDGDMYVFNIQQTAQCSARQFGNWTRFINHSCIPNVSSRDAMYGRRAAVLFRAACDIIAGEQLFISYGRDYFTGNDIRCICGVFPNAPHWPPEEIPRTSYPDDDIWRLGWKNGLVKQAEAEGQTASAAQTQTVVEVRDDQNGEGLTQPPAEGQTAAKVPTEARSQMAIDNHAESEPNNEERSQVPTRIQPDIQKVADVPTESGSQMEIDGQMDSGMQREHEIQTQPELERNGPRGRPMEIDVQMENEVQAESQVLKTLDEIPVQHEVQTQPGLQTPPENNNTSKDPCDIILEGEPESPLQLDNKTKEQDTSDDEAQPRSGLYSLPCFPFFVCADAISPVSAASHASGTSSTSFLSSAPPTPPPNSAPPPSTPTLHPSSPSSSFSPFRTPSASSVSTLTFLPSISSQSPLSSRPSMSSSTSDPYSPEGEYTTIITTATPTASTTGTPKTTASSRSRTPSIGSSGYRDSSRSRIDKKVRFGPHGMVLRSHTLRGGERKSYKKYF